MASAQVGVRVSAAGDGVHLLAPGPEGAAAAVGAAAQRPVEGVRVGVGQAGQGQPGQPGVAGGRGARRDRGEPVAGRLQQHAGRRPVAAQPGVLGHQPVTQQVLAAPRRARDAGEAVGRLGGFGRGVGDAGRVADEQHRGRDARRRARPRRGPAPVAAPGAARSAGEPARRSASKATAGVRLLGHLDRTPCRGGRPPRRSTASTSRTRRRRPARGCPARRRPPRRSRWCRSGRPRPGRRGQRAVPAGGRPGGEGRRGEGSIGSLRSASRVVPAWSARPVKVQPPPPVRPDRAGHARPARRRPARGPARRAARRSRRSGAARSSGRARRVDAGGGHRLGQRRRRRGRAAPRAASGSTRR